jgi:kynurenine formamidase
MIAALTVIPMRYIDLTQTFSSSTPVYPGDPVPELSQRGILERDGFSDFTLSTGMHVGTHIDGPLHMIPHTKRLDEFDVSSFIGTAKVIDARGQKSIDATYISKTNLTGATVALILTGWSSMYGKDSYYHEYPILTEDAAEYLVSQGIQMIGLDGPSPDQPPFPVHKILLKNNVLIIENLTNIESLIMVEEFEVLALPIKVSADSALCRVIARVTK